ncbi:single-stranded-DNA-specific exonuclease RecJ [Puniceicoccus vermicola]|uniref:Single-stranded-DNA-specific exonuclease RecJ n=1 Tax=Puniceicoccus vermicola TaxID=388746 RepID=A0A7X1AYK0_9BACT|nr:single-stranded-DNA-specific exonuclease RecJ [Puniceicoccus vermicola]MBC2602365.1 single-stranded-DNA-specific exonuclease RecJ [Puniceicoccus vermicola]
MAARILVHRLGKTLEQAEEWISPRLENILDPFTLLHCEEAAARLTQFLREKKSIGVFSDYDVDGISSAALISCAIRDLGGEVEAFVPDRLEEGYGLSIAALERSFADYQPDLLLVLDCGTRSEVELEWIAKQGTQVIVVDHHSRNDQPKLPEDCLMINPHLPEQLQPEFQNHCTVGLVFKLVHALLRKWDECVGGARDRVNLKELLDLVAMGTVADLVPLRGENRVFVHHGLKQLAKTNNHGLRALLQVSDVDVNNPLSSSDIGFRLGPRINAGGRIETGALALDLLMTKDNRLAFDLARKLDTVNSNRRSMERRVSGKAIEMIGEEPPMGIVVWDRDWHPGVVGIVAGRLARKYHRPAIVLGWDGTGFKGSGRGISGLDLLEVMQTCTVKPPKWGGHPAAMGMSIEEEDLPAFAEAFSAAVTSECGGKLPPKKLRIDAVTEPSAISRHEILEIEALGPFGQENPEPIVAIHGVRLEEPARLMGRDHIRFNLPGASGIQVIGWRMAERMPPVGSEIDLALRLSRSWWRGRESVRGELVDWRQAEPLPS